MKNLKEMTKNEITTFFNSFDTVITDINGVLFYLEPIPGAEESIKVMKALGKNVYYVSNNTTIDMNGYKFMFKKIDVDLDENNLIFPTTSTIEYLKETNFIGKLFCIASKPAIKMFTEAGIQTETDEHTEALTASEVQRRISDDAEVRGVFVDFDPNLNYMQLNKAINVLKRDDVQLIFGATDSYIPLSSRDHILGPGIFQSIISDQTKRNSIGMGKPSEYLKSLILKRYNIVEPQRVLFIGDMLHQDMKFGSMCGFQKLLVFSGVSKPDDLRRLDDVDLRPDFCVESMAEFVNIVQNKGLL